MRGRRLLARGREETAVLSIHPVLWQTGMSTVPLKVEEATRPQVKPPDILLGGSRKEKSKLDGEAIRSKYQCVQWPLGSSEVAPEPKGMWCSSSASVPLLSLL
ncbi:hypothetical protein MC885_009368 [Smutsia gigantea]|nr:hypothetical protein MC885_009368 [Smutsia gigantea]